MFPLKPFVSLLPGLLGTVLFPCVVRSELLLEAAFESGQISDQGLGLQKCCDDSLEIVAEPVRSGRYAARTLLRNTDEKVHKGQRSEFSDGETPIQMSAEYWYGLSIFVPEDFEAPPSTDGVLFQWHTQQGGPSPMLAIRVSGKDWKITTDAQSPRRTLARLPMEKGKWTDWVVQVKWSPDAEGYWTIWKDGEEVARETGIVTDYPEEEGPYAKFGQYHSVDRETPRNVVFFDEYRVAGPGGSFEMVAPGGGAKEQGE